MAIKAFDIIFYSTRIWKIVNNNDIEQIFTPTLKVANTKSVAWFETYGAADYKYFWFKRPHHFEFRSSFRVDLYCTFEFNQFPFDSHQCDFFIGGYSLSVLYQTITPPTVHLKQKSLKLGDGRQRLEQKRLQFNIDVKVMDSFEIYEDGFNYSYAGMRIYLKRKSLGVLAGGFFIPTGSFSVLSLMSFSIHYENVNIKYFHNLKVYLLICFSLRFLED